MSMTKTDKQALRAKAEMATQGEWWIDSHGSAMVAFPSTTEVLVVFVTDSNAMGPAVRHEDTGNLSHWRNDNDASFIAAANPATVLALLDELEAGMAQGQQSKAAVATLEHHGFTWHGGEQWKPPLGLPPEFVSNDRAELQEYRKAEGVPVAWMYDGDRALPPPFILGPTDPSEYWKVEYQPLYATPQPSPAVGVMPIAFFDGDISPADAEKLTAVIREFNEDTERPAAKMARIIRENPHPKNMCDMPAVEAMPVVPSFEEWLANTQQKPLGWVKEAMQEAYEGCRAAMQQPVSNRDELPEETGSLLQLRNLIRQRHAEWSQATFGDVGPVGPLKHLSKEALEAAAEPGDLSEWADMQFLLWDAQRRAGLSDGEITAAMEEKLKVNMARQWPEPKDGEPRQHIKAAPQQEVKRGQGCR